MTIQDFIDQGKINITGFADPSIIQGALESVYANSSIFRIVLDDLNDPGRVLNIEYQLNAAFVNQQNGVPGDTVFIDPNYAASLFFINETGNFESFGLERTLIHEVIHAVAKLLDPPQLGSPYNVSLGQLYTSGFDYQGPTTSLTEQIEAQANFSNGTRIAYQGFYDPSGPFILDTNYTYTNNNLVDVAVVWGGLINTTGSNTSDLVLGNNFADDEIITGLNADYLYGLDGDDVLDAGDDTDQLFGGAGADLLLAVTGCGDGRRAFGS